MEVVLDLITKLETMPKKYDDYFEPRFSIRNLQNVLTKKSTFIIKKSTSITKIRKGVIKKTSIITKKRCSEVKKKIIIIKIRITLNDRKACNIDLYEGNICQHVV